MSAATGLSVGPPRKRPVNLMINEALVAQAKGYINNLSAMAQEGQTIADVLDELLARSWG